MTKGAKREGREASDRVAPSRSSRFRRRRFVASRSRLLAAIGFRATPCYNTFRDIDETIGFVAPVRHTWQKPTPSV
jgi:hypothetical protein